MPHDTRTPRQAGLAARAARARPPQRADDAGSDTSRPATNARPSATPPARPAISSASADEPDRRARRASSTSGRTRAVGRPTTATRPDSRARLLAAAGHEFAEHGFAGASVDRIARRARLNKAMIYYHFTNKLGLYREVLREMYRVVGARVGHLAERVDAPRDLLAAFVATVVHEACERPYFPRVVMRELADRARHIDADTLALAAAIPEALGRIMARGVRSGTFRPMHPAMAYFTMIGSILTFFGTAPLRAKSGAPVFRGVPPLDTKVLTDHCQHTMLAMLSPTLESWKPTPSEPIR